MRPGRSRRNGDRISIVRALASIAPRVGGAADLHSMPSLPPAEFGVQALSIIQAGVS